MSRAARRAILITLALSASAVAQPPAPRQYDPGASDSEIRIGNIVPYTGAFSEYGATGRAEAAYFKMINDQGGINGRKIVFLTLDSASGTTQAVTLAHRLVEQDRVLLLAGVWGAPANLAIRAYLNEKQIPQLFSATNEAALDDPAHFPWTMGFQATKRTEGLAYARCILQNRPAAKVAILYSRDPSGEEWLQGVHDGLSKAMIVREASFEYNDPRGIDPQVASLKNSGADVFLNLAIGKFATQAILKAHDLDWHPLQFIPNASLSTVALLDPADRAKASGILSNARSKGWLKPQARQDPAVRAFLDWMKTYNPDANLRNPENIYGYEVAQTLVEVLTKCGGNLTRANVMKQAANLDLTLGMLRPGIRITTSPTDYQPIKQLFLIRFDGQDWAAIGNISSN